jgi:hypothetical protein
MLFQLRTDNHIANSEELTTRIQAEVESALHPRFTDRLRRVEVYIQDTNGHKGGIDKRCAIEAHPAGLQAIAVDDRAAGIDEAVSGAVAKLLHALDHRLGRIEDRNGRVSMSGEPT